MKIVSLITARGGSKGIPNKNITPIFGKPLIAYTINASLDSNADETWVSTDDLQIAKTSRNYGAEIVYRPKELCNDTIMPDAALVHFAQNYDFDILVFIQPTSPLLSSRYINLGLDMMNKYDSVFSAYKEHWQPRWDGKDSTPYKWDINNRPRRQDQPELYVENGAFYITTKEKLLQSELRYSGNIGIVKMPIYDSFQIDSKDDLELIKRLI